jgi:glycosyltransferase involved in cell wall biosynthesis
MKRAESKEQRASTTVLGPLETLTGVCGILIPAFNEDKTVAIVARVAVESNLGPVLVVDDGSSDQTVTVAENAGATVLKLPKNLGKGGAVFEGIRALQTEIVLLIDADLTGLTTKHLKDLAQPVLDGKADMSRGVFTGGRWTTTAAQQLTPQLNGQRAIKREKLLKIQGLRDSRYGIEIAITEQAKRENWRTVDVAMPNVSQVMKEEKRGFWQGLKIRLWMYADILRTYLKRNKNK